MRTIAIAGLAALITSIFPSAHARSETLRIVSWNAKPALYEGLEKRLPDFQRMAAELKPDILVLIEEAGAQETKRIARELGWSSYHAVVTNWNVLNDQVHFALEAAVISKIPTTRAVEYDASPDGHHQAFTQAGELPGLVSEQQLSASGIPGFGETLGHLDRGTMRVDLANGLTIFPLHLKSNRNGPCMDLGDAIKSLERSGFPVPDTARNALTTGFPAATNEHVRNAKKRERVMAATARLAAEAANENRIVVIAGDWNTSFEPGKHGTKAADCNLKEFSCAKGPFPAAACADGDGYDDTLGMLEEGLVSGMKWKVLSRNLGRTYDDTAFADHAIDHFAVTLRDAGFFHAAEKAGETFGSDHFPIMTTYSRP